MSENKRTQVPPRIRFMVFRRDNYTCRYCGRKPPEVVLHVDHVRCCANKGRNELGNYATSCETCNLGKGTLEVVETFLEFLSRQEWRGDPVGDFARHARDVRMLDLLRPGTSEKVLAALGQPTLRAVQKAWNFGETTSALKEAWSDWKHGRELVDNAPLPVEGTLYKLRKFRKRPGSLGGIYRVDVVPPGNLENLDDITFVGMTCMRTGEETGLYWGDTWRMIARDAVEIKPRSTP